MANKGILNTFAHPFMPLLFELMACREQNNLQTVCAASRSRIRLFQIRCALFSCALVTTVAISSVKSANAEVNDDIQEIGIDYLWSHKLAPEHVSGNLVLRDIAITSDERLLLLSDDIESALTVIDLNQKEPPETHWLDLIENIRGTTSIAVTDDDEIYIGGNVNKSYPSRYSDGYLAQIDIDGRVHWEWTFETGPTQRISQIRPLTSSDLIIASSQSGEPYISRFKPKSTGSFQANAYWTTKIGFSVRKGYRLSVINEDKVAVSTVEIRNERNTVVEPYSEDLILWHLSGNGEVIDKILVRESLNNSSSAHFNHVAVVADEASTYVASSKMDWPKPLSVEVSRIADRQVAWSELIPETVKSTKAVWVCPPALSIIDNGDVLMACAVGNGIDIYHFEKASGKIRHLKARLPECTPNDRTQQLFITRWKEDKLIIAGSRTVNNVAEGCSWAGLISWP